MNPNRMMRERRECGPKEMGIAGLRWTRLWDGETTNSVLEAPYVYYSALNMEAGLLLTAERGGGVLHTD